MRRPSPVQSVRAHLFFHFFQPAISLHVMLLLLHHMVHVPSLFLGIARPLLTSVLLVFLLLSSNVHLELFDLMFGESPGPREDCLSKICEFSPSFGFFLGRLDDRDAFQHDLLNTPKFFKRALDFDNGSNVQCISLKSELKHAQSSDDVEIRNLCVV